MDVACTAVEVVPSFVAVQDVVHVLDLAFDAVVASVPSSFVADSVRSSDLEPSFAVHHFDPSHHHDHSSFLLAAVDAFVGILVVAFVAMVAFLLVGTFAEHFDS